MYCCITNYIAFHYINKDEINDKGLANQLLTINDHSSFDVKIEPMIKLKCFESTHHLNNGPIADTDLV